LKDLLGALMGQDRAVANARAAATELSRRRVEREEVALYLDAREGAEPGDEPAAARVPLPRRAGESRPR